MTLRSFDLVQRQRRLVGWTKPEGSRSVTRPTRFGNWWRLVPAEDRKAWIVHDDERPERDTGPMDGAEAVAVAVARYEADLDANEDPRAVWVNEHLEELRGVVLLCYCDGPPCHAYVLASRANS